MNVEIYPRQTPLSFIPNGDVVELDHSFYLLADKKLGEDATLVLIAKRDGCQRTLEYIGATRRQPLDTLVIHHPHAKLVIP